LIPVPIKTQFPVGFQDGRWHWMKPPEGLFSEETTRARAHYDE
jgi:hypothetical protein